MGRRQTSEEVFKITAEAQLAALNDITRKLGDVEGAIGDLNTASEQGGAGLEEAGGGIESLMGFASSAIPAVAALGAALGALSLGVGFVDSILDLNDASNLLQAQTGLTGDELQDFVDIGDEIYKANWGDSLADVHDVMQDVHNITGLENDELQDMATHALAVRDIFEADIKESVRAADTLMEQFGVDGTEAFDAITAGFQRTGDPAGDLLDTFNEYSGNISEMRFSVQEFLEILQGGLEGGARNTDDLADSLREFNTRLTTGESKAGLLALGLGDLYNAFTEGDVSGAEIFKATVDALDDLGEGQEQANLAFDIFGTRAEDMGLKVVLAMDDAIGRTEDFTGAMEGAEEAVGQGLHPAINSLKRTFEIEMARALEPTVIALTEELEPALKDLADWIESDGGPALQDFAIWMRDEGGPALVDFANFIGNDVIPVLEILGDILEVQIGSAKLFIETLNTLFDLAGDVIGAGEDVLGFVGIGGGDDGGTPATSNGGGFGLATDVATGFTMPGAGVGLDDDQAEALSLELDEIITREREVDIGDAWRTQTEMLSDELDNATADRTVQVHIQAIWAGFTEDRIQSNVEDSLSNVPSFHGGGVMPFDGLANLRAGERVLTPEQAATGFDPGGYVIELDGDVVGEFVDKRNRNRGY